MRLAALALSLALTGCAAKYTVTISAGADLASTEYGLARGAHELNPLLQSRTTRVSIKAAAVVLILWACHHLDAVGAHDLSDALQWTATVLWGGAAGWNLYQTTK